MTQRAFILQFGATDRLFSPSFSLLKGGGEGGGGEGGGGEGGGEGGDGGGGEGKYGAHSVVERCPFGSHSVGRFVLKRQFVAKLEHPGSPLLLKMGPLRKFEEITQLLREVKRGKEDGKAPVSLLLSRNKVWSSVNNPLESGRLPRRLLLLRYNSETAVRLPISGAMGTVNPKFLKSTRTTRPSL